MARRRVVNFLSGLLIGALVTACGATESTGTPPAGTQAPPAGSAGPTAGGVAQPGRPSVEERRIVALWIAPISGFAATWCKGLEDAAADWAHLGVTAECTVATAAYETPAYVDAINAAVAAGYKGIIVHAVDPGGIATAIENATAQGVEVLITSNGGKEAVEQTGALMYVGADPYLEGRAMGKCLWEGGARNIIANDFNAQGVGAGYLRAQGSIDYVTEQGGKGRIVPINGVGSGPDAVKNAEIAALTADPTIDGVSDLYAALYNMSVSGFQELGLLGKIKLAFVDTHVDALDGMYAGHVTCMTTGQGWLQGYMSVVGLAVKLVYEVEIGGLEKQVLTGPFTVDKNNFEEVDHLIRVLDRF
jgi:ABC-type sugar transport system substrate-binding protein